MDGYNKLGGWLLVVFVLEILKIALGCFSLLGKLFAVMVINGSVSSFEILLALFYTFVAGFIVNVIWQRWPNGSRQIINAVLIRLAVSLVYNVSSLVSVSSFWFGMSSNPETPEILQSLDQSVLYVSYFITCFNFIVPPLAMAAALVLYFKKSKRAVAYFGLRA